MVIRKINYISSHYFTCDITPKRITKRYELEIYLSGKGATYIDGKSYLHTENKVVLAKPGQGRFSTGEYHCYAVHFSCDDPDLIEALHQIPDCCIVSPKSGQNFWSTMSESTRSIRFLPARHSFAFSNC